MNNNYQHEKTESDIHSKLVQIDPNSLSSSPVMAMGGTGGSGGSGGAGGQAVNITYVDNYSMISLLSTLIILLVDNQKETMISKDSLLLINALMEEQKEYRQELLEVLRSLKQCN